MARGATAERRARTDGPPPAARDVVRRQREEYGDNRGTR